jgi:hypothetical protein
MNSHLTITIAMNSHLTITIAMNSHLTITIATWSIYENLHRKHWNRHMSSGHAKKPVDNSTNVNESEACFEILSHQTAPQVWTGLSEYTGVHNRVVRLSRTIVARRTVWSRRTLECWRKFDFIVRVLSISCLITRRDS